MVKTQMRVAGAGDKPHSRFLASPRLELGVGGGAPESQPHIFARIY